MSAYLAVQCVLEVVPPELLLQIDCCSGQGHVDLSINLDRWQRGGWQYPDGLSIPGVDSLRKIFDLLVMRAQPVQWRVTNLDKPNKRYVELSCLQLVCDKRGPPPPPPPATATECGDDHAPVTRGRMRARYPPLPHGPPQQQGRQGSLPVEPDPVGPESPGAELDTVSSQYSILSPWSMYYYIQPPAPPPQRSLVCPGARSLTSIHAVLQCEVANAHVHAVLQCQNFDTGVVTIFKCQDTHTNVITVLQCKDANARVRG